MSRVQTGQQEPGAPPVDILIWSEPMGSVDLNVTLFGWAISPMLAVSKQEYLVKSLTGVTLHRAQTLSAARGWVDEQGYIIRAIINAG
jgi:hypothetical protein